MKSSEMKKATKRILAMLLCTSMVLSSGVSASADEGMAAAQEQGHVHTEACYEKQNTGNLICTKAEVMESHVHGDECYETTPKLTCEQEEHSHDDGCYTTETKDVCNDESEEHTCGDACVETEEVLTCTAEEHSHNDGCYETETNLICGQEEVEAHIHNDECYAWEEKLVCTLPETAPAAEQPEKEEKAEEAAEINLQNDDETGIKVSVKSTSDVLSEDTKVVVAPMEIDEEHETALAEAVSEFEVLGYTAYDISLKDAEDEDITLGENKVEVAIDFEELIPEGINAEEVKDVVLVHITTDEEEKLTAETVGTVEITEEKATVEFEADSFSPYVVTYLSETEEAVEEVVVEEPVVEDVVLTYTSEDEAYTATVTAAPEVLENVTAFEAVPVTDEGKITALTEQLTAKAAEMQKTSLGFENYEFRFLDAEENEVSVNGEVKVSLSFAEERIPEAATAENVDAVDAALLKTGTDDKGEAVLEEINGLVSAEAGAVKEVVYTTEAPEELILAWSGDVYRTLLTYEGQKPAYEDDEVIVTLVGTEYALQNVVGFNVMPIKEDNEETKEQYAEVAQQLDEKIAEENEAKEVVGFLAYDITLVDAEGNELEPQGNVRVSMEYKEAAAPETVAETEEAEVTIHHFEEDEKGEVKQIVDMVAEETIEAEVTTTKNAEVEKAEFVTDSFSTYTITWTVNGVQNKIVAQVVDKDRNQISGAEDIVISKEFANDAPYVFANECDSFKANGKTYALESAIYSAETTEKDIRAVRFHDNQFQYEAEVTTTGWWGPTVSWEWDSFANNNYQVYLIYEEVNPIPTVDSRSEHINIRVSDYSMWSEKDKSWGHNVIYNVNNGHDLKFVSTGSGTDLNKPDYNLYTESVENIKNKYIPYRGIVKNNLYPLETNIAKYPSLKVADGSLDYLFNNGYDANYLFKKDTEGYYVYDSAENFAELNTSTGDFTVYDQSKRAKKGFFPFNKFAENVEFESTNTSRVSNHHFGMSVDFTFMQPKDGKDDNKEMIFEFNGDDDVWVFVDGMLVLDIGGIHQPTGGTINFATGQVTYKYIDDNKGEFIDTASGSTIRQMYEAALAERYGSNTDKIKEELAKYFIGDTSRFKDYSGHTLNFYYLERGAHDTNCKIKFNLISIPANTISIEKEITESNMADFLNADFKFKIEKKDVLSDGTYPETSTVLANTSYKLYNVDAYGNRHFVEDRTTDGDGIFYLKHKQVAEFGEIPASTKYCVKEIGVVSEVYDRVTVNGTGITMINERNDGSLQLRDYTTGDRLAQDYVYAKFGNACTVANLRNLIITKEMVAGQQSEDTFKILVEFKTDNLSAPVPYVGDYYRVEDVTAANPTPSPTPIPTTNGIIELKANQAAYIYGLISGTQYQVTEQLNNAELQKEYGTPVYSGTVRETPSSEPITGTIEIGTVNTNNKNHEVIVTNTLNEVKVQKIWNDADNVYEKRPENLKIKINYSAQVDGETVNAEAGEISLQNISSESSNNTLNLTIARKTYTLNVKYEDWSATVYGLPSGYTYSFTEESVEGYSSNDPETIGGVVTFTNTLDVQIIKCSTTENKVLEGAIFKLVKTSGESGTYYGESQKDGIHTWYSTYANSQLSNPIESIPNGTYTLSEEKAPTGYLLSEEEWTVEVVNGKFVKFVKVKDANGNAIQSEQLITPTKTIFTKADGTTQEEYAVCFANEVLYELPSTGGDGIYTTMLSGFALMLGAAYVWFKSRREESSNN